VRIDQPGPDRWRLRRTDDVRAFTSSDPDTERIWWRDGGVHQNLTFAVQPDPISGMHCWHQKVTVEKARAGDRYGDIEVDTAEATRVYREWLARTAGVRHPGGLRRPTWLARAVRPSPAAYRMEEG
jgi:hypothetical protein